MERDIFVFSWENVNNCTDAKRNKHEIPYCQNIEDIHTLEAKKFRMGRNMNI